MLKVSLLMNSLLTNAVQFYLTLHCHLVVSDLNFVEISELLSNLEVNSSS